MTEDLQTACPEAEELAEFVEGRLSGRDRARVQAHLADCEVCPEVVAEALRMREEDAATVLPFWRRRRVRAAGGVLALAASLLLFVQVRPELNPFRGPTPYEELVAAVGTNRTVEGRLSGGFEYGPLRSATRSAGSADATDYEMLAAAAKLQREAQAHPTAANLHAIGVAKLVTGDLGGALTALQDGVDLEPGRADLQNDLAAALVARGKAEQKPQDFALAVAAAERAIRADPNLIEAYFNRALALSALQLDEAGAHAWREYLKRDSSSGWSIEGRRQLENNSSRLSTEPDVSSESSPRLARMNLETRLFKRIASLTPGSPELRSVLDQAEKVSSALAARTGDADPAASFHVLKTATSQRIRRGYGRYADGRIAFERDDISTAMQAFKDARVDLAAAPTPLRLWCDLYSAIGAYYASDYYGSSITLRTVLAEAVRRHYRTLEGRAQWMLGLNAINLADLEDARARYTEAERIFSMIGEREEALSVRRGLWEVHRRLGLRDLAWLDASVALSGLRVVREPRRRHSLLMSLALGSLDQRLPELSRIFLDMAVREADAWGQPAARVEAHSNHARADLLLGDRERALRELTTSRVALASVPVSGLSRRLELELLLAEADAKRGSAGVRILTEALPRYAEGGRALQRGRLYLRRAELLFASGDITGAETDYAQAVAAINAEGEGLAATHLRDSRVSEEWSIYEAMVEFQVARGRYEAALSYLDEARSLSLIDKAAIGSQGKLIQATSGLHVVSFMLRDDKIYVWSINGGLRFREVRVPRATIDRAVDRFVSALRHQRYDREIGSWLYRELLAPELESLAGASTLVIIPDGSLHSLPFAALMDRSGRMAVEQVTMQYAPSISVFAHLSKRQSALPPMRRGSSMLIVGDPRSQAPALLDAQREAEKIAGLFDDPTLLVRESATSRRLMTELVSHAGFHFAGHAVSASSDARRSYLVLSPDMALPSGQLRAADIERLDLTDLRLAVLSACATAAGDDLRGLGPSSLARSLMSAGVTSVVGTLWDVDDSAVSRVWPTFYSAILAGRSIPDALREAQLAIIHRESGQLGWAALISTGGFARASAAARQGT